jgi:hypothetical protein
MRIGEMKDSKTKPEESTWLLYIYMVSHIHWVVPFLLSYILRFVSFAEVGSVCRVALREPMHLCTCVSEEGGDGEAA